MQPQPESKYVPALGFHWLTPWYDAIVGATTRERRFKRALIEQARVCPGHRVLDLATGTGTLAIWLKQREPEANVAAADGDPAILAIASRKARDAGVPVQFDCALSYQLPYPAAHFDRVLSSLFFHHLSWTDKVRTAGEVRRVLKPGGELHVADWGRADSALMRGLFLSIQILDGFANTRDNVTGRLVELFEQAGYAQVAQRQTIGTIFGTMALYSAVNPA